jgi:multidrug efflux pump subunit AcrA (membrane-fusion protein)
MKINLKSGLTLVILLAVAFVVAFVLVRSRAPLEHVAVEMPSRLVQVIGAKQISFRTRITAYGNVEPAITLHGMAEVSGKISYLHPNLKAGETISAGTLVVRIEAEDYALTLKQTQEDLKASLSSLQELDEEEKSTRRSLQLAQKNLEVGESELARIQDVYNKQLIAKSALDAEQQRAIQLRRQVEDLQGRLNSYASRRSSIAAQIARAEQEVQNRTTILGRTEITLPFDARIGTVSIEQNEFVSVGSLLFEAIDLEGVEITAQLPLDSMRKLVSHMEGQAAAARQIILTGGRINDRLGLTARVRLVNGMPGANWEARVLRISEAIDATRQTLGIVVGVDKPYEKMIPGKRPPLLKGMYTAVDLLAPVRPAMVIPRKAIHQGRVYLANAEDRLLIRPVEVQFTQGDMAVIRSGIEANERVIVTELIPVIEGMPLLVSTATRLESDLLRRAGGEDK